MQEMCIFQNFPPFLSIFFRLFFIHFALNQDQNFWSLIYANFIILYKVTSAIYAIFLKIKNLQKIKFFFKKKLDGIGYKIEKKSFFLTHFYNLFLI